MTDEAPAKVRVTFAKGVLDDVAELTTTTVESDQGSKDEVEALKRRIAELLVECKGNPFVGELMGPGLHPELESPCAIKPAYLRGFRGAPPAGFEPATRCLEGSRSVH
jgi:hypothetical protein